MTPQPPTKTGGRVTWRDIDWANRRIAAARLVKRADELLRGQV